MNIKRFFGTFLSILAIGGLILNVVLFAASPGGKHNVLVLFVYGILGLIFFTAGISLVRTTKDES
jgi:hypothetical protein